MNKKNVTILRDFLANPSEEKFNTLEWVTLNPEMVVEKLNEILLDESLTFAA